MLSFLLIMASIESAMPVNGDVTAPSLNSTTVCNWTSAADIVRAIQSRKLNTTQVVAQCDDVCKVVFGSGNPVGI